MLFTQQNTQQNGGEVALNLTLQVIYIYISIFKHYCFEKKDMGHFSFELSHTNTHIKSCRLSCRWRSQSLPIAYHHALTKRTWVMQLMIPELLHHLRCNDKIPAPINRIALVMTCISFMKVRGNRVSLFTLDHLHSESTVNINIMDSYNESSIVFPFPSKKIALDKPQSKIDSWLTHNT